MWEIGWSFLQEPAREKEHGNQGYMVAEAIKEIVIGPNSIFQSDKEIVMESVRATYAFKNSADKNAVGFIAV